MRMTLDKNAELSAARARATSFESNLDSNKRKRLGQFFTGLPLSRILAALSVRKGCTSVIDPMAGHGDLLDAVLERCFIEEIPLSRVDAIELDFPTAQICRQRLQEWQKRQQSMEFSLYESNAFAASLINTLPITGYDLVITNPPYVRYQTTTENGSKYNGDSLERIRETLLKVVSERIPRPEQNIWRELVHGFSGLSDLSVPAWLLAAMLVKPNGTLALVAPATWRSRDYADVLQYLLVRCFQIEIVIADRQPGWFSKALVRTHLVVATRLPPETIQTPLRFRNQVERKVVWVEIDQIAKGGDSLVGAVFDEEDPEGKVAEVLLQKVGHPISESKGIVVTEHQEDNISSILSVQRSSSWLRRLEPFAEDSPLFFSNTTSFPQWVPKDLKSILPEGCEINLLELSKAGIGVSQGLRTGCNGFFYVEMIKRLNEKKASILVSEILGSHEIIIPIDALKPVVRRQSELDDFELGLVTSSFVLDLRGYVLPEDSQQVEDAHYLYRSFGVDPPKVMPKALADLVRMAAKTRYGSTKGGKYIPELTAVKTNTRENHSGSKPKLPRFWYMLPDFMRRHLPDAFVPRINQDTPFVLANRKPPLLIDANFSTLWAKDKPWTSTSIKGVLNSAWARACMEAIGTPMGGGALKLEATHLRRMPIPKFSTYEIRRISEISQNRIQGISSTEKLNEIDHIIVKTVLGKSHDIIRIGRIISELYSLADRLKQARHRV